MALKISNTANTANAITFGGSANTAPFNMAATGSFSLIFKLNAAPANNNRILCKNISGSGTSSWGVRFLVSGVDYFPTLVWYEPTIETQVAGEVKSVSTWYQIVGAFDTAGEAANKFRLYMNGEELLTSGLVAVGSIVDGAPNTNSVAFSLGKDQQTGNNGAPMDVAEFEWTSTPILSTDAANMYNGGLFKRFVDVGVTQSNYWPMTDTSATTTIEDTVGSLDGTGSGITAASEHPPMWYLQPSGEGPRGNRIGRMRGLAIPRGRVLGR